MPILNQKDFENAKRDIDDIGKSVNTESIIKPRWGEQFKSIPLIAREGQSRITELNNAINQAAAAGAGANGWTDQLVLTWSGRTQEQKNKDEINVLDFGAVLYGLGDSTAAIQRAIDYAASLSTDSNHKKVVIDIPVDVSKQRTHSTGWGSVFIVPSNVIIAGTGKIFTQHNYANRSIIFMCRGSNIDIQYLSFENTLETGNYDIPVGGGTTYDDGLVSGTTYKNINLYNVQTYKNWLGASFQMRRTDDGTVTFEDINYLFCRAIAREGNTSSGNFNFRSDPPHKIKNASMSMCHAENGATASSFNYVGIKGGNITNCTSKDNLYAGCELENGTEGITVSNLTSIDDYASLWVDDSSNIIANTIIVKNTKDTIVSPLLGTRGKIRPAVLITYQGFETKPDYVTDKVFINNIVAENGRIVIERFGTIVEGYSPSVGSVHIDGVDLTNDVAISTTPVVVSRAKKFTLLNSTIVHNPDVDCVRIGGTLVAKIENLEMTDVSVDAGGVNIVSVDTKLVLRDSNISKLTVAISTRNFYSNNTVNGSKFYDLSNQIRTYPAMVGTPEGVLTATLGSEVTRLDDFGKYIKTTSSGNTGWKRLAYTE